MHLPFVLLILTSVNWSGIGEWFVLFWHRGEVSLVLTPESAFANQGRINLLTGPMWPPLKLPM